jgi:hypothetical protein
MKVPLQSHGAQRQPRPLAFAVQVAHRIQHPVLMIHQPVHSVGGARTSHLLVSLHIIGALSAQLQGHLLDGALQLRSRPLAHAPQPLRELPPGGCLIAIPDSIQHLAPQRPPTAVGDLQDPMQKAQDQADGREQLLPGQPRRSKAICADGLRLVVGLELLRFLFEFAVACPQRFSRRLGGQSDTKKTALGNRCRRIDFLAIEPGDFLIGNQVQRQLGGVFDGGADKRRPPQLQPSALPEAGRASEDISQRFEGNAELAQVESLFDLIGTRNPVRQDQRRTNREDGARGLELDAPQAQLLFLEAILRMKLEALGKSLRKQLRVSRKLGGEKLAQLPQVVQASRVMGFTGEGQTNMMVAHGWLFGEPPVELWSTQRITPNRQSSVRFFKELVATHKIRWHQEFLGLGEKQEKYHLISEEELNSLKNELKRLERAKHPDLEKIKEAKAEIEKFEEGKRRHTRLKLKITYENGDVIEGRPGDYIIESKNYIRGKAANSKLQIWVSNLVSAVREK